VLRLTQERIEREPEKAVSLLYDIIIATAAIKSSTSRTSFGMCSGGASCGWIFESG
jgi:hypothetical protein